MTVTLTAPARRGAVHTIRLIDAMAPLGPEIVLATAHLGLLGPCSITALAKAMGISINRASRIANALVSESLVQKQRGPNEKQAALSLTLRARGLLAKLSATLDPTTKEIPTA